MKKDDILDIITLVIAFIFLVSCIVVISFVVKYRELEFNRLWRTRFFITILLIVYSLLSALSNLKWYPRQFNSSEDRSVACCTVNYFQQMFVFPFFLSINTYLLQCSMNLKLIQQDRPNRTVFFHSLLYVIFPAALGLVNLILVAFKHDITFFVSYDEDEQSCVDSSYFQVIIILFIVFMLVILSLSIKNKLSTSGINMYHRIQIKRFPYCYIPLIIIFGISIIEPYVNGTVQIVFRFIDFILTIVFMFVFLYLLVFKPTTEAANNPLRRGHITKRHGVIESLKDNINSDELEDI